MKPYIGILIDSFWEAVSSKVLWALLIGSTLVLAALAPFGITVERSFKLSNPEINGQLKNQMFEKIAKGLKGQGSAGLNAVASRINPKLQDRIRKKVEDPKSNDDIKTREIVEEFNRLLTDRKLFDAQAFQSTARIERYKEIINKLPDQATDDEVEELNRRLLFTCFSTEMDQTRGEQLFLSYAGFKITDAIPLTKKQIRQYFEPIVLMGVLKLGLAVFTIFVAIIVTSSIIPETFRSGSLHLMLSKPISRTWLFLSKFFGGCSFVLVNFVYIILGLYLIAGLRFGIWNNGLLYCIPLLLFVFIIFYCVSSLAGILWGNAIVCVVSCMVFWGFCFAIGFVREVMHDPVESNQLISRVTPIEDQLFSVTELGKLQVWNAEHSIWQPATDVRPNFGGRALTFGPILDPERRLIYTKSFAQVGPFDGVGGSGPRNLVLIDIDEKKEKADSKGDEAPAEKKPIELSKLRETGFWSTENGPDIPLQVSNVIPVGENVIAVCRGGIFMLDMDAFKTASNVNRIADATKSLQNLLGLKSERNDKNGPFKLVSPEDLIITDNVASSATLEGDGVILHNSGKLSLLSLDGKKLKLKAERKLEGEGTEAAIVAANKQYCLVARMDSPIELFDREFNPIQSISLPKSATIKQWYWNPGQENQLTVVTQQGYLFTLDCDKKSLNPLSIKLPGKVTCLSWKNENEAYVGVAPNQVHLINMRDGAIVKSYSPQLRRFEMVYNWIINPLYKLNPKPAAMDDAMAYLLTGKTTFDENVVTTKLESSKRELSIWQPIFSNLAFVIIVLGVCCIYVTRKEY